MSETHNLKGFALSGIAICNVCLQPCKIFMSKKDDMIKSHCCVASVVHRNVLVKFKKEKFP